MLTTHCRLALRLRIGGDVPLLALYTVMLSTGIAFSYTGVCSAWCPLGPLNYVLRTEVIAYHSYIAGVNNLQFYAHSSYWNFVKCCFRHGLSSTNLCVHVLFIFYLCVCLY